MPQGMHVSGHAAWHGGGSQAPQHSPKSKSSLLAGLARSNLVENALTCITRIQSKALEGFSDFDFCPLGITASNPHHQPPVHRRRQMGSPKPFDVAADDANSLYSAPRTARGVPGVCLLRKMPWGGLG